MPLNSGPPINAKPSLPHTFMFAPLPSHADFVLAAVLLLAGGTVLAHQRVRAAIHGGNVKYIHVITPNTSCDGIAAAAAQQIGGGNGSISADASAALLQHILPLTNFSALRTGQILDSAAASATPAQQLQPLMQLHQHMWCR